MTMLRPPSDPLAAAVTKYLDGQTPRSIPIGLAGHTVHLPMFRTGTRQVILADGGDHHLSAVAQLLRSADDWLPDDEGSEELVVAVAGAGATDGGGRAPIRRGVRTASVHQAIADFAGLPAGWASRQQAIVEKILEPLRPTGDYRIARLRLAATETEPAEDVASWFEREFRWGGGGTGRLTYLRAEAGKGKSTTLADLVRRRVSRNDGPLPLLIPLRELRRESGVSWPAIALTVGVVGEAVNDLGRAVRAGLILLLLDGLDEVSGRYNPVVIQDIVRAVRENTLSADALVGLSGRTTEGLLLGPDGAYQRGLELPELGGHEFRTYARDVIDAVLPGWSELAARLPEPALPPLTDRPLTVAERDVVLQWVLHHFGEVGKDRSLFFVQSLACLARTRQLDGNKPIFVQQPGSAPSVQPCLVSDACLLAASFACDREVGKVADDVRPLFTAARQLDASTWFAVLASAEETVRNNLPGPNHLIAQTFDLDPVAQTEEMTAITRQMQKHALLYSTGGGVAAGDWQPAFLSEWTRAALLARAWTHRNRFPTAAAVTVARAVARSGRARIAFESILPEHAEDSLRDLIPTLVAEANADSPEACANYWHLMQGLPDDRRVSLARPPERVVEMTDFSAAEFEGHDFGPEFSANLAVFVGVAFFDCTFRGVQFTMCDLTGAEFVGCRFENVTFQNCDGPVRFDGCRIQRTTFEGVRSFVLPAWTFGECSFDADCRFIQNTLPRPDVYARLLRFVDCSHRGDRDSILEGPELGQHPSQVTGLDSATEAPGADPAIDCLRRLLRTFFPTRAGDGDQHQARDYIRSSAVGRGAYPEGSPGPAELTAVLTAEGFNRGGRQNHLYAPWSGVGGDHGLELRNELSAFLANSTVRGPAVKRMLDKIRKAAGWPV